MPVNEWLVAVIVALTPVVLSVIDYLCTKFGSSIPSAFKPLLAMGLGAAATFLAGLTIADPMLAALVGLAAAGIRQVVTWLGRAANVAFFK